VEWSEGSDLEWNETNGKTHMVKHILTAYKFINTLFEKDFLAIPQIQKTTAT